MAIFLENSVKIRREETYDPFPHGKGVVVSRILDSELRKTRYQHVKFRK